MLSSNSKHSEVTFKCRQHNQKAEVYCKIKYCPERLLCSRCMHPHTDTESIDSLFAFSTILKQETAQEDNSQFVNKFMTSIGDVFRSVKSTEESLLWLHQMLISVSESSAQFRASVQSMQLLSFQLTNFLSQCKDVKQISDSRPLNELIEWYLTLRTAINSQKIFDERDREYMCALSQEVSQFSRNLREKVVTLTQKFDTMKRGGTVAQSQPVITNNTTTNNNLPQTQPQPQQRIVPTKIITKSESNSDSAFVVKSEEKHDQMEEEGSNPKIEFQEQESVMETSQSKRNQRRQTREMRSLLPQEPKAKADPATKKQPKKAKNPNEGIEKLNIIHEEPVVPVKLFESGQKESISIVEKWLKNFESSQEKTPEQEIEASQIKKELELAKELVKASQAITAKPETNPVKQLKKDMTRIFNDLLKSPDNKPPEIFLASIHKLLEETRDELIVEFKSKATEDEIRQIITKMKESRIELRSELSKLIEICLEYQLRLGKLQSEIVVFQAKETDFMTYQNAMERFCRLRLHTPNAEQTLTQFFEVKAAQVYLEYFFVCLQRYDLSNELQTAYSNSTNEIESMMIFQRLQLVSISKAKEILAQATRPTQVKCTFGDTYQELTQMVEQAETLRDELEVALQNYQVDQVRETLMAQAEKSLQSRLYFDQMSQLKPFNPRVAQKIVLQPIKPKKIPAKSESKAYSIDSDEESMEEYKISRCTKKVKIETAAPTQLNVRTRSTRIRIPIEE